MTKERDWDIDYNPSQNRSFVLGRHSGLDPESSDFAVLLFMDRRPQICRFAVVKVAGYRLEFTPNPDTVPA